jgi:hypothetical protein
MKNRNELMTVDKLYSLLTKMIEKGNGNKFIYYME